MTLKSTILSVMCGPTILAAMPLFSDTMQIVTLILVVLMVGFLIANYLKAAALLTEVRDLLAIAKAYNRIAGQQQAEAARTLREVPKTTSATVKKAIHELRAEDSAILKSGEIPVQHHPTKE